MSTATENQNAPDKTVLTDGLTRESDGQSTVVLGNIREKSRLAAKTDRYDVGKEIARGGMGAILEATDPSLDRVVAMKVMLAKGASVSARLRFTREAVVLGRLEHPNIVPIYEFGSDDNDQLFYTMKKVEGETLQAIINSLGKGDAATITEWPLDRLLAVFLKICDAIAFAHSRGVIHRDLKPDNVMIGAFGEVLVMD